MKKPEGQQLPTTDDIREQFDFLPYPNVPPEKPLKNDRASLFNHNRATAHYRRTREIISSEGAQILDAGCGSGYGCLLLAKANPGSKVTGVDLSERSVSIAQQRLKHHGHADSEFHVMPLEELPKLGRQFDYINCDETLYLLPDPKVGLEALRSALKPEGILRVNFHSQLQRKHYFQAQQVSQILGLQGGSDQEAGIRLFRSTMQALKKSAPLRNTIWDDNYDTDDHALLANHLLRGDKGMTVPEFLAVVESAGLAFISMVDWQSWNVAHLFKEPDNLPEPLADILEQKSPTEKLQLFELISPSHRLLDIWCCRSTNTQPPKHVEDWKRTDWSAAVVHLHPQLNDKEARDKLRACALSRKPFDFYELIPLAGASTILDTSLQSCLLPLWDSPTPFLELVERCQAVHPVNPVTLAPMHDMECFIMMRRVVSCLVDAGYLMACLNDDTCAQEAGH